MTYINNKTDLKLEVVYYTSYLNFSIHAPQGHFIRSALYDIYIHNVLFIYIYDIESRADKMPLWMHLRQVKKNATFNSH